MTSRGPSFSGSTGPRSNTGSGSAPWSGVRRPFAMAQQLRDACRRWLLAGGSDVDHIVDLVVLEQFIARLPRKTAEWVQCHRPTSLETAINLAEDHLVACPGVGEPPLTSHSLSPPSVSPSRPVPLPRSRPPGPPRVPPRGRGGMGLGPSGSSRAPPRGAGPLGAGGDNGSGSAPSPRSFSNPLPAAGAGLACWRCGDPDHFVDRCPMMDQRTTPDQAGEYQIP
ncbi:zinc finger protein with KRAB and SCAN domains 7-like [Pseudorasbora parva]|uniref:zinc finger protein with KRAB and SCAN domains 7-like n=1 Tax=Pseudorasbora parva TaxID=51549 RepID=UPI00351F52E6